MSKSLKRYFFAFDGIDGCGKDTQLNAFFAYLKDDRSFIGNKYANIWISRQPTKDSSQGETIARLIRERDVSKEEATKFFVADRIYHSKRIRDMLDDSFVLVSRCDLSTFAYQMAQGMDFEELYNLHKYDSSEGTLIPDVTFVFDLPVEVAANRMNHRDGIFECFEKTDFQHKVFEMQKRAIDLLHKRDGRKFIIVNANQSIEDVTNEMISKANHYLEGK